MENRKNTEVDYRKNEIKYLQLLGDWLQKTVKNKKDLCILRISELDDNLTDPKQWFESSLFIYDCLLFLLEVEADWDSFLFIPLSHSKKATNTADINYSYLQSEIFTKDPPLGLV